MGRLRHARPRRLPPVVVGSVGTGLLIVAVALVVHVAGFYARSSAVGGALIAAERSAIAKANRTSPPFRSSAPPTSAEARTASSCPVPTSGAGRPAALLEIPAIGLSAPVLQGATASVLAVAVGHDPASAWPAGTGTVVLDGHDVTWFHRLPRLRPGQVVSVVDPCETVRYRVVSSRVVPAGTPVANLAGRLVLVTCYPLDALFFTTQRFVLTAAQIGHPTATPTPASTSAPKRSATPSSGVPASWATVDTLAANPTPLGALQVAGHPSASWSQSPSPLDAAAAIQEAFFASLRQAESSTGAWKALHIGLPLDAAVTDLSGQQVVGNLAALETTLEVEGSTVRSGVVTDGVALSDGAELALKAVFEARSGSFLLTTWSS